MNGITMNELYERISHSNEAEFVYKGIIYMLQTEVSDKKSWLVIWNCSDSPKCICRHETPENRSIPKEVIDVVLSEKCFNGKSFFDIENEVNVTVIY